MSLLATSILLAETRESETNQHAWYMYFGDHPFGGNSPWSFHFDGQLRMDGLADSREQLLLRPGLNYDVSDATQLTGGYAFIDASAGPDAKPGFNIPEHRFWEQAILKQRLGSAGLVHRYRLEQRLVGKKIADEFGEGKLDGYQYRNRFRYFLKASVPLGEGRYSLQLYNELMMNFGKNSARLFDQNRAYAAVGINIGRLGRIELGYLMQVVQRGRDGVIVHNHTVQVGLFSSVPIR